MKVLMLICLATTALSPGPVQAQSQDASGKWDLVVPTSQGHQAFVMSLKKDGEKLTGTVTSSQGEAAGQGTQKDSALSLTFTFETERGKRVASMTGTQNGDVMKGSVDLGNGQPPVEWTAKRTGPAAGASGGTALDVSGVWAFEVQSPAGTGTPTMTFKQAGEAISGSYAGQLGEAPLSGTLNGTAIKFRIDINVQGNALTVVYSGTVEGGTAMKGTVSFGELGDGTFTAKKK